MGSDSYQFYENPNLKNEVLRFFHDLDSIWKKTPLPDLRHSLFQLEFSLRQVEPRAGEYENFISNVLEGIRERLDANSIEDFSHLQAQYHLQLPIGKDEQFQSLRKILLLIYFMNPKRVFKDLNNQEVNTLADMGFFMQKMNPYLKTIIYGWRKVIFSQIIRKQI